MAIRNLLSRRSANNSLDQREAQVPTSNYSRQLPTLYNYILVWALVLLQEVPDALGKTISILEKIAGMQLDKPVLITPSDPRVRHIS